MGKRVFVGALVLIWVGLGHAATPCELPFARLVSVQGSVELRRAGAPWQSAAFDDVLCLGDSVRVAKRGRAALWMANETTLRLDQNTELTFVDQRDGESTLLQTSRGGLYFITRTPKPFRIRTPFVNANVEGTEFLVRVGLSDTEIAVFEGSVVATNDAGRVEAKQGEQMASTKDTIPVKTAIVRPRDAVEWALHVPTLLDTEGQSGVGGTAAESALQNAVELNRRGRIAEALEVLEAVDDADSTASLRIYLAALLLQVGRLDEAEPMLERVLQRNRENPDANALMAIVALVRDNKTEAERRVRRTLELSPSSVTARIALSYVQQANFDIDAAASSVEQAVSQAPGRALAWARLAELQMSRGALREAMSAAHRAVELDPALARTQTLLGFAQLARADVDAARESFLQAARLDQADPLPRLGLGLCSIRSGDLQTGRISIEIAASLDPTRSILRSYLGKAYFEEKRDALAAKQFALAKERDPMDPTPYLYDAIRKQANNEPVEALEDLLRSVALNDARAVYRSRLLLDQDRATRQVNVASLLSDLASERAAVALAGESVAEDPSNAAAHRFLSDAYARRERHEIARVSELLQAQMLRPLGLNTVAPELTFTDLSLPESTSLQGNLFTGEPSTMFERDRSRVAAGLMAGSEGTSGKSLTAAALRGVWSGSVGYFAYDTDGFRPNSDIEHEIGNAFLQFAPSPDLSAQMELRKRRSAFGDVELRFDPSAFMDRDRYTIRQDSARLGVTFRPAVDSTLMATAASVRYRQGRLLFDPFVDVRYGYKADADAYEAQYALAGKGYSVVAGGGYSRLRVGEHVLYDFSVSQNVGCPADFAPCDTQLDYNVRQWNAYLYSNLWPAPGINLSLGVSRDTYSEPGLRIEKWNPKLGARLRLSSNVTLRLASFGRLKRSLVTDETLEPTQVLGFNQFYDDVDGSVGKFRVAALDFRADAQWLAGIEMGQERQEVATGRGGADLARSLTQRLRTEWFRLDASWLASKRFVIAAAAVVDRFAWPDQTIPVDYPTYLRTEKLPLSFRFLPAGPFVSELVITPVRQVVQRREGVATPSGSDRFTVVDASLRYRLPIGGTIGLEVKNLFNEKFFYQDDNFRATEVRLSPFLPTRRLNLTASLAF